MPMRLKKLKLSGFKSFVDPTTVPMPSNLMGVVGPNGCGKSNIIDAVRWVMGESSAKQLRGEAMADVIFNGCASRKPVGQAAVELLFDNSDGSIGGEYASFSEIGIRRQVNRDGQSSYFLNNTRCRRKDITEIFLGTGLGPRSYSIIEQGMISKLIEAKPDDLRLHLEEAAGISKYKERRRETELRIKHTRENLDRLNDIRETHVDRLKQLTRQKAAAEKYKILKADARTYHAQVLALRWRILEEKLATQKQLIQAQEIKRERLQAELLSYQSTLESLRENQHTQQEQFNKIQEKYYSQGAEIARLEESIQHQRDKQQTLEREKQQITADLTAMQADAESDQDQIQEYQTEIEKLTPQLAQAQEALTAANQALHLVQSEQQQWQSGWDEFNQNAAKVAQQAQVEQTRIQHLNQQAERLDQRLAELRERLATQQIGQDDEVLAQLQQTVQTEQTARAQHEQTLQNLTASIQQSRDANIQFTDHLDGAKNELQNLRGRFASLETLQQAALGQHDSLQNQWLSKHNLADNPRLAQGMEVDSGWETAVETALGQYLQAVCVEGLLQQLPQLGDGISQPDHLMLIDTNMPVATDQRTELTPLSQKIKTQWKATDNILSNVYAVDDLSQAIDIAKTLAPHQSVITPDGIWLGCGWLRVAKDQDAKAGILQRETQLKALQSEIVAAEDIVAQQSRALEVNRDQISQLEQQRELTQQQLTEHANALREALAEQQVIQAKQQQAQERSRQLDQECESVQTQLDTCCHDLATAKTHWQAAVELMDQHMDTKQQLQQQRETIADHLNQVRANAEAQRNEYHAIEIRLQSNTSQLATVKQNQHRSTARVGSLQQRQGELAQLIEALQNPDQDLSQKLQEKLTIHQALEAEVRQARTQLEAIEAQLRQTADKHQHIDQQIRTAEQELQQFQMAGQEHTVRQTTLIEQLTEVDQNLETVLNDMPAEAEIEAWETELERINNRIQRLGAINLVAIEEFDAESERKMYLDSQYEDLTEALAMLENAMHKIDQETKARFKDTYEKVNSEFKSLFPRLFGGGQAYLELTGHDLLETGVTVIARPPGKRNSSINLLSGGEKALTAIALIFSIFQLNPAPFCLLDEVDAPLDDTNVLRFCELVKEMSKTVQFIFITHNKITMEMAHHLAGVTQHEAGVSRMVSVDIDEAVSLVEA